MRACVIYIMINRQARTHLKVDLCSIVHSLILHKELLSVLEALDKLFRLVLETRHSSFTQAASFT